jgi:hypothetical protein
MFSHFAKNGILENGIRFPYSALDRERTGQIGLNG